MRFFRVALAAALAMPAIGRGQAADPNHQAHRPHASAPTDKSLAEQVSELRAKVANLETAMQHRQMGMRGGASGGMQPMGGMGQGAGGSMPGMGAGSGAGGMGMDGMMGMMGGGKQPMGQMQGMSGGGAGMGMMRGMMGGEMGAMGSMPSGGMSGMDQGMMGMMGMSPGAGMGGMAMPSALPASRAHHISTTSAAPAFSSTTASTSHWPRSSRLR